MRTAEETLAAIDAALEEGRASAGDAELREFQELALALRADAPEPDPEFAATMDERVAAGFAGGGRAPAGFWARIAAALRGGQAPAIAAAASVLVALVVAVSLTSPGPDDDAGGGSEGSVARPSANDAQGGGGAEAGGGAMAAPEDQALRTQGRESLAPPPAPAGDVAPGASRRRVERTIELRLAAPDDRLERVAEGVVSVTARHRGFVSRSSLRTGGDEEGGGTFELRIPQSRLRVALADLSRLATVRATSQSGEDVTAAHASVEDELAGARAQRRSLLRRLEAAQTDDAARALRRQLRLVSAEIRGLSERLRSMRERVAYAAVTVTLESSGERSDEGGGGAAGDLGDAVDDATDGLLAVVGLALRALGVLLPLGLATAAGWLAVRGARRRRREAALG
jgi:hypothetical protein